MQAAVSVRALDIAYNASMVVKKLDLDVAPGEFLVLLGPSGCGKSTLLNAIAGLVDIADGEVWIEGRNVTWAEPKDRGIGMVFQSYALYPRMTVKKNLSFGLRVAGVDKAEIESRVAQTAALLHLDPLLHRRPAELSGGQRQRVAIGRALVRDVDVFLFDEPLSNLDAKLRNELRVEIKKLHQKLGNTMIYVTHDQVEALTLADRIAVMRDGIIQQLATPAEIYHRPVNQFVAGFIGAPAMNFLDGTIEGTRFVSGTEAIDLAPYSSTAAPPNGRPAVFGIRPEHIELGGSNGHRTKARVIVIEPTGADTVIWCDLLGKTISVRIVGDVAVRPGDLVDIAIDTSRASLFDAETGRRL